jgi:cytochrome c biogenesis protein
MSAEVPIQPPHEAVADTQGWQLSRGSQALRASVELLSSMRFAISLLTVICIASVIGTVLKQNEPLNNYVNQFGPFWADVFGALNLYTVYSSWWFLLILAFLVISTSLCIARNTPKILVDIKTFKENMREQSLKAFGHRAEGSLAQAPQATVQRVGQLLAARGWKVKVQPRPSERGEGYMIAAKAGTANKLGYIAAHSAIVLVCIGGLLDGDLFIRAQQWLGGKEVYQGGGMIADVKPEHRLAPSNPAFRGNLFVAEGTAASTAVLSQPGGILLQDLPFSIELKKFIVEYYSTGMPKLFASEIVIHDKETGEKKEARVEVNHPASHRGIEIYQSSFDDGGSTLKMRAMPLAAGGKSFDIEGAVGGQSQLTKGQASDADKMTLEYTGLRVINVENFGAQGPGSEAGSATDVRKVDLQSFAQGLDNKLGAPNKVGQDKGLRNVGPSVSYKLRDAAGQAVEFNNYMLPVVMDPKRPNEAVFLLGMRKNPNEAFSYLRVPADDKGEMDGYIRLRQAMFDPAMREQAVNRYIKLATDPSKPEMAQQLQVSALRAISLFAGAEQVGGKDVAGLQAIADFMESAVPAAERERAGEVLVRILNGTLFELLNISREQAGLKPLVQDENSQAFLSQAVIALSDAWLYPAPMAFMLTDFKHVQASVFQVARAPGKWIVYFGCLMLIIGVFAMLYVRERRLWIWVAPKAGADTEGSDIQMALSVNRKIMDSDKEFEQLRAAVLQSR